ncbi:MAG: ATP-binding protein [Planctomycetota bacterium]|jgi:two-component system phosphate regulon sensor histidine kinase PhoR
MRVGWIGKIIVSAVGPVLVAMGVFGFILLAAVRDAERSGIEEALRGKVAVLADAATEWPRDQRALAERVRRIAKIGANRVTVIAPDGTVLADSSRDDVSTMENHGGRPEIRAAKKQGNVALRARYSATVRRELLYAAAPVGSDGTVVRIARDYSGVQEELNRATQAYWFLLAGVVVFGVIAATVFGRRVARPVAALTEAAEAIAAGDLERRVHPVGNDEIARLGRSFNEMTQRLAQSLEAARSETARLGTLIEAMTEGVLALDSSARVSFLNGRAREILGLDPEGELVGRPIFELIRDPRILNVAESTNESRLPTEEEIVQEGPPRRILHLHARPVEGGVDADTILVVSDLSRMRRLERMRSDFVANVSHELRTPLASIAAAVETLEDEDSRIDPESGTRFVAMIKRNVKRLEALLNDILALSRLESRPETLRFVPVDFGTLVRLSSEELEDRARAAGVRLNVSGARNAWVMGDAQILRRIVDNLVVNAITYTLENGRVDVELSRDDGQAVLRVRDSGIGIPEADLGRIFERFYRVDKGRSRHAGGTGLGLAIVKHAVGLHDGKIEVESALGEGTLFTVRLPLSKRQVENTNSLETA